MKTAWVDTDIIIRFLTGDDPLKQEKAASLFLQVEAKKLILYAPVTVIADAVFVLSSKRLYNLPREKIYALLIPLLKLPGLKVLRKQTVITALLLYSAFPIDFGDAMLVAYMRKSKTAALYSFDTDFDDFKDITRLTP